MKTILSSRRHRYVTRVSIFLIAVALIAGMVGCGGGVIGYNLTMAANPVGGGTATDLTNASPYTAGTAVSIKAVAAAGYRFVNWTAPAGTFANSNAAETTFTIPAQHVTVTANFVRVYNLTMAVAPPGSGTATDLTNASPYTAGTGVSIKAVAAAGYQFVNWTAPAGTFANSNAAETTFTMPAQNVAVTANFTLVIPPFSISNIVATPTKIGNAVVITWDTDVPTTNNIVVYDQSSPPRSTSSPGLDNVYQHAVVITGITPNSTYYYRVGVTYLGLKYVSSVNTFVAKNAKNAWDGSKYTINMMITLDWDVPSTSDTFLTTWFTSTNSYMAQAAQYIYDATDGYIRLGTVLVADNQTEGNMLWNSSDMTFKQNTYDSTGGITPYTYYNGKWNHTAGIENPNGGVGMGFGEIGSFYNEDWSWDSAGKGSAYWSGWQARIITHEFGHYALYLPDRYDRDDQTANYSFWDTNNTYDSDLMSDRGYWAGSTFKYYTEFGAKNCYKTGYSDPFGEGNAFDQPPLWVDYSSWYIIINSDPFAGSGIPHYTNAHYVPAQGKGVEPAYPDVGPTNENGGVFNLIFINN
ncbi:MAG: fibronectin type III domain-containing protein [Dehalococcoidia bacterium]